MAKLTQREREVVSLLARGERPIAIARRLCISRHTVYNHVARARSKTGATSAFDLAVRVAVETASQK